MTEAAQVTAQTAPTPQFLSARDGAKLLAERRTQEQPQTNSVSDAARTLGQRAAEARKQRTTDAQANAEEVSTETGEHVEDEQTQAVDEPQDETVTAETPSDTETPETDDGSPIDLGEGVKLSKAEIRENIMLKADHTRRLQAMAEKRRTFEGEASQKLAILDQATELLGQRIGQPKALSQFMKEYGDPVQAAEAYDAQQDQIRAYHAAVELKNRQQTDQVQRAIEVRDQRLAEDYNSAWLDPAKRDADYTAISQYAVKLGATAEQLMRLTDPWMIQVLDKAMRHDSAEADKSKVTKAIAQKPPVVRPGTKVSAGAVAQNKLQSAQAQLNKTGSMSDALAYLRAQRAARG